MIGGYKIRVPMVDVNAIGAGGGSDRLARPARRIAGRTPLRGIGARARPATAAAASEATVTDASIVLGYLDPDYFAGGAVQLEPELAREAIERRRSPSRSA